MDRRNVMWGAALMAFAVALGAFGAHGLKARLTPDQLGQWNTGVLYHFLHALGLLVLAPLVQWVDARAMARIRSLFLLGCAAFSGSLYLLSTRALIGMEGLAVMVGPITPIGGLCFIGGWTWLLITVWRGGASRWTQRG